MTVRGDGRFGHFGRLCSVSGLLIIGTALALGAGVTRASEETVDRLTKVALAMDANPKRGGARFDRYCARCHGANALGDAGRRIPVLAGQRFAYLVRQLANLSGDQRDATVMHNVLSAKELQDPQAWADIAAYLNGVPVPTHSQTGDGKLLGLGEGTYRTLCASCHFDDARGDDDGFVPSLRNQHYSYLLGQLQRISEFHRHNIDENIARLLRSLDADEVSAVADYLSRLNGRTKDRKGMRSNGAVVD